MADNYLEKRYEELREGRPVIRRVNASLDSLLSKVGEEKGCNSPDEEGEKVKAAQFEALKHSAERLGILFSCEYSEVRGEFRAACSDMYSLGQIVLAVRLKAAELKLFTEVLTTALKGGTGDICSATIKVGKR